MARNIPVIAEIVPAGEGFPVVSDKNVKVGDNTTLKDYVEQTEVKIPAIKVSRSQPADRNCLWIEPID